MYKPTLKRQTQHTSTNMSTNPETIRRSQIQNRANLSKQRTLVPEAFFQQSKNIFTKKLVTGLVAPLNTCEYNYPKAVEDEITTEDPGHMIVNEEIFCFYKQKNIYFWQYQGNDFTNIVKFAKMTLFNVITSVAFRNVKYFDFGQSYIKLVAISQGTVTKFYCLHNFTNEDTNCIPHLSELRIQLHFHSIITDTKIIFEEEQDMTYNKLYFIAGDENGTLNLFDFVTKKKRETDTLIARFKRQITQQNYTQIMQILPYRQFVFCLVKRHYEPYSMFKQVRKFFGDTKVEKTVQQLIQVYKIQTSIPKITNDEKDSFKIQRNGPIKSLNMYKRYPIENIIHKMQTSYNSYFQQEENLKDPHLGSIDQISLKKNYVEILFKSGQSILADQEMSFAGPPKPRVRKPNNLGIFGKNVPNQSYLYEKSALIKSLGTQLMLFEGFIASSTQQCLYATPYSFKESPFTIRSVQKIKNNVSSNSFSNGQFIVLGLKTFTFIQQVTPILTLFLYCSAMAEQYRQKKYHPTFERFKQKIQRIVEQYGQVEILTKIIEFLIKVKQNRVFRFNVRLDLFEISVRQMSQNLSITYEDALKCYEENQRALIKNSIFYFTKNVDEMIWKVIFQIQKTKIQINYKNQWKLRSIQAICVAFQLVIGEIFKDVKDWDSNVFANKRSQAVRISAETNILQDIIETYMQKESQYSSRRIIGLSFKSTYNPKAYMNPESQSLKIRFCFLSKSTLEKLRLVLGVYETVCETHYKLPKYSETVLQTNRQDRISFSTIITQALSERNQILMSELISKAPQLQIDKIHQYRLWSQTHNSLTNLIQPQQNTMMINQQQALDRTYDISVNDIEEVADFINEINCKDIQDYFLAVRQVIYTQKQQPTFDQNKYIAQKHFKGIITLLQIGLRKILTLRQDQIKTTNILELYKRTSENYFGLLETPTLEKKLMELLKQIQYFTNFCLQLIDRMFKMYTDNLATKEMILSLLDTTKGQLTIQVRKKIEKGLETHNLTSLLPALNRRQLFSNNTTTTSNQSVLQNNFMVKQLY